MKQTHPAYRFFFLIRWDETNVWFLVDWNTNSDKLGSNEFRGEKLAKKRCNIGYWTIAKNIMDIIRIVNGDGKTLTDFAGEIDINSQLTFNLALFVYFVHFPVSSIQFKKPLWLTFDTIIFNHPFLIFCFTFDLIFYHILP